VDYGLELPNYPEGASPEGIEAAADVAERLGWSTVWTTDHVLVPNADRGDYGRIYEAILTLAWVGARHPTVRLGTSVIVVPQRNAVILAKELATLDSLSGGRVIAGIGIGWNQGEYANLGVADRFHVRGAYLDETIRLWRHLWSGSTEPFEGRFHALDDFVFNPLPPQGKSLPIFEDGLESRDFVHVTDVARAVAAALKTDVGMFDVFNVGLGKPVSVMEIATKLMHKLGGTIAPHVTAEYRVGDIRHCYADITRIGEALGYQPQVDIDAGLDRFVAWVRTQPLPADRLDQANEELRRRKLMA